MLSSEYIAGFFDGEGSITLTKNGQCKIAIVQKEPEVLRLIQVQFGGCLYKRIPNKLGGETYALVFSKKELMLAFLQAIRPFCVVKRGKVEIAIQFVELTQSNQSRKQDEHGCYIPVSFQERDRLRELFYRR